MLASLNSQTIGELDNGLAGAAIDEAINQAMRDVEDRGDDGKPRKVLIELLISKEDSGHIAIEVTAKTSVPAFRLERTIADIAVDKNRKVKAQFRPSNARRPDQPTLDDVVNNEE